MSHAGNTLCLKTDDFFCFVFFVSSVARQKRSAGCPAEPNKHSGQASLGLCCPGRGKPCLPGTGGLQLDPPNFQSSSFGGSGTRPDSESSGLPARIFLSELRLYYSNWLLFRLVVSEMLSGLVRSIAPSATLAGLLHPNH